MSADQVDKKSDQSGATGQRTTINVRYILFPAILPVLFFVVAAMPVEFVGCRLRGLAAALIALTSGFIGIGTGIKALVGKTRGRADAAWWIASTLILAIPLVAVVVLAG